MAKLMGHFWMFNRDFASKEVLIKEKEKGGKVKKRKEKNKN
jgi:hypothetical protein